MPDEPKVLHLTIKRCWFDEILRGEKVVEYREIKPYWTSRLEGKHWDEVHFRNGYREDSPFMRVELLFIRKGSRFYIIYLGKVLEVRLMEGD